MCSKDNSTPETRTIVFFDGECLLCSQVVHWCHRQDRTHQLWFAALESDFAANHRDELDLPPAGLAADTFVFWQPAQNSIKTRSEGVCALLQALRGPWPTLATLLSIAPLSWREHAYNIVAHHRNRLSNSSCPTPPASLQARILL